MVELNESKSFNAICIDKYKGDPKYEKFDFCSLSADEILIKVKTSTIHPADLAFVNGQYGRLIPDVFPIIPGGEGSGIIQKVGSEINPNLIGKRVSVMANSNKKGSFHGLWAEYHITTLKYCIVYDKEIDFKKLTFALGNPLTALGFLDTLKKHKVDSVVQNGSTSAFGKMFIKLCKMNNIKNISIVRKEENINKLYDIGAFKVISTTDSNWKEELCIAVKEINATVCFECVGGQYTGQIISCMPKKSTIYHFGNLELKRLEDIGTSDFIFDEKVLKGWWLMDWVTSLTEEEFHKYKNIIRESLEEESKQGEICSINSDLFITGYSECFKLDNFENAFIHYLMNMNKGKIILEIN